MAVSQLFATSWHGLGRAETPITADKGEIFDFPKLPTATSFIRNTLSIIYVGGEKVDSVIINARKNYLWKLNRKMEGEKCLEFSLEKW